MGVGRWFSGTQKVSDGSGEWNRELTVGVIAVTLP